jgi:hypothetical protein
VRGGECAQRARLQAPVLPDERAVEVGRDDVDVAREGLGKLDQALAV